jgi:hypothetical protein
MCEKGTAQRVLVGNPEGKILSGISKRVWEHGVKKDLKIG